ncbi:ferredoxin [Novosphingobium sp. SG720]|uniref:(2Fe-2S)-binding protein n=1 Tax=Novosphingobium sp. SG720 TaxID=2586998 RepID=UPI0014453EE2|nr:ferredoxin [Novosphingobium sp. SG720]NKJ42776.1 bacterioferritin-associated ferredoxin [Novosphingobium sp. SG720]
MYICICNAIREKDLRQAARCHARGDAEALYGTLGCRAQCRQCLDDADDVVADERACAMA